MGDDALLKQARRGVVDQSRVVESGTPTWFLGLDCGLENGASNRTFKRTYSRIYCDLKLIQLNDIYAFI